MVRLQTEMAVISTIGNMLINLLSGDETGHALSITLDKKKILDYTRNLENDSGYAILNGFSEQTLDQFFINNYALFQFDPDSSSGCDSSYRLRLENLHLGGVQPDHKVPNFSQTVIRWMINVLDPAINYPMDLLRKMGVLDVLAAEPDEVPEDQPAAPPL
jgi:hypothetical protein